jgi:putative magnesium chelatase accessory protein
MIAGLDWQRDGREWPNREASRFVSADGIRWHTQSMGRGPHLLLVHGTGGATHSWRRMLPLLARDFTVLAPDLPGHGFTELPPANNLSLPGMAASLADLLKLLHFKPEWVIGHSAGAAILARLCLDRAIAPLGLVSLNGCLLPLGGLQTPLIPAVGRAIASSSMLPQVVAGIARVPGAVERMLRDTGSNLEPVDVQSYRLLAESPRHVAAAVGMMAMWDTRPLAQELPRLDTNLTLIAGVQDKFVPLSHAYDVARLVPGARVIEMAGLGHLAHEERPDDVHAEIAKIVRSSTQTPAARGPLTA